jgi:hypothetical protein
MKATIPGSPGEDRADGIATDASGNVYEVIAAEGSLDGQPYAGEKDVRGIDGFVTFYSSAGELVWMTQFGTPESDEAWGPAADPSGGVYLTGYTAGDFSGTWPATRTSWSPASTATAYPPGGTNSEPPATTRAPH